MLDDPTIITPALCALSLRAIKRGQKPHLSLRAIREHRAWDNVKIPDGLVVTVKTPRPSKASVETLSRLFEARCTPEDFRQAASDRTYNCLMARKYARA